MSSTPAAWKSSLPQLYSCLLFLTCRSLPSTLTTMACITPVVRRGGDHIDSHCVADFGSQHWESALGATIGSQNSHQTECRWEHNPCSIGLSKSGAKAWQLNTHKSFGASSLTKTSALYSTQDDFGALNATPAATSSGVGSQPSSTPLMMPHFSNSRNCGRFSRRMPGVAFACWRSAAVLYPLHQDARIRQGEKAQPLVSLYELRTKHSALSAYRSSQALNPSVVAWARREPLWSVRFRVNARQTSESDAI